MNLPDSKKEMETTAIQMAKEEESQVSADNDMSHSSHGKLKRYNVVSVLTIRV